MLGAGGSPWLFTINFAADFIRECSFDIPYNLVDITAIPNALHRIDTNTENGHVIIALLNLLGINRMTISNGMIVLPLLVIFIGALAAGLLAFLKPNKYLGIAQQNILLSLAPAAAFIYFISQATGFIDGNIYVFEFSWMPSLGLVFSFYVDSLSAIFALLITFIGFWVVIYTGQYFKGEQGVWRFNLYLFLFMGAMLGLVMAGDIVTLFVFWESTSITSYLLIAYNAKDPEAQRSGYRALFITGGGGIALLGGLVFAGTVAGGSDFTTILSSGDVLRAHPYYWVILSLIAFGAFTKSAQFPAHIWLPGAMSAPTPASAYLHSATMVKAGIYLLARLNPALGSTEIWFWLLSLVGLITMLVGAYLGLKQNDLKGVLAYSTVSQLGVLVMLIGQNTPEAFKAFVIGLTAHALYKSALFLIVGIIDHEAGTRDLRRLGGLRLAMPITFVVGSVAALSMAGFPPMFGFLAKETLLAAAIHPTLPQLLASILPMAAVVNGALMLAQAGMVIVDTFLGKPRDAKIHAHEAPWLMILAPLAPTLLSLVIGLLPETQTEAAFLASAASVAYGDIVKVSLKIWQGINVPLILSLVTICIGGVLFWGRSYVRKIQEKLDPPWNFDQFYFWVLHGINRMAHYATRLQMGSLRTYMVIILLSMTILVLSIGGRSLLPDLSNFDPQKLLPTNAVALLRVIALFTMVSAAVASIWLKRDFAAILAMGASGLGLALYIILEPALDVALVQVVVDILSVVILVLALGRLPVVQRRVAQEITNERTTNLPDVLRDAVLACAIGAVVMVLSFVALSSRPRESFPTAFYEANAKELVGAKDIVGAIVVDFRAVDTLFEITVFSTAGLGVFSLLRFAARKHKDLKPVKVTLNSVASSPIFKKAKLQPVSAFIRVPAYLILPFSMILAITHLMYGHDQPGDGFTAGVIVSLAVGLWYVVFGYEITRQRLTWIKSSTLIAVGVLLAIVNGSIAAIMQGSFLANVDYGELLHLVLPRGFHLSSSFIFELAIFLSVFGSATRLLDTLGRPDHLDIESEEHFRVREDLHEHSLEGEEVN